MSVVIPSLRGAIAVPGWAKNELWRNARAVPSLDLRFADNKSLTDAVTGASLVTFTRASSGTFVDSAGVLQTAATGVPRFDHNPTTGGSLGLLVEEQRTNLLLRSEAIATSPWFAGANTTLTNNTGEVLDPAGGSTATKVLVSGGTGAFGQAATLTAAIHTGSIWLRCSTGTISANLIVYLSGSPFTNIGTTNVTITTFWQRFTVVTSTATATAYNLQLNTIAVGTIYAWGAQLEAGAFPTSYIPTSTAAVTRSADVASITGANFSSWYRQDEGTVFADINTAPVANIAQAVFDLSEGAGSERIFQRRNTGGFVVTAITDNSVVQGDFGSVSIPASGRARSGLAYRLNDFEGAVNGSSSGTDTSATVPTIDRIHIGQNFASGQVANGTIRRICFWPQRLANSTLQQITQ